MSDIPQYRRLDPLSEAGPDNSQMEALPSYEEAAAGSSTVGRQQVPSPRQQETTSRRKPQPPSSSSSSSLSQVPESHRQYHQHYTSLFSTPAPPAPAQNYSSLLPPLTSPDEASPGIPPNYDLVTSSIPDRFNRRAPEILPEGEREIDKERARIQAEKGRKRWGRTKSQPKPEGVPLEQVCDRFGNRKREIKPPSTKDMVLNPPSIRKALSNVRISY